MSWGLKEELPGEQRVKKELPGAQGVKEELPGAQVSCCIPQPCSQ